MTREGYIKLYRSIQNQPWYKDSEAVHLFVHLLINAAFAPYQTMTGMRVHTVEPGQLVTGRKRLAAETAINESKIQRLLKVFEECGQIEQQTNNINRCVSIVNWHVFQEREQPTNNQRTTDEQPTNNERTLNKNIKNIKEDKEDKGVPPQLKNFDLIKKIGKDAARMWVEGNVGETLNGKSNLALEWLQYRAEIGSPIRAHAEMVKLVKGFSTHSPERLRAMMDYSIGAQYTNLYPDFDKDKTKDKTSQYPNEWYQGIEQKYKWTPQETINFYRHLVANGWEKHTHQGATYWKKN